MCKKADRKRLCLSKAEHIGVGERMFTEDMVHNALQTWCDNVVAVGKAHSEGGDARAVAVQVLHDNYDYDNGKVLFKPTLTFGTQTYRPTKEGALAYFTGGDENFPDDNEDQRAIGTPFVG